MYLLFQISIEFYTNLTKNLLRHKIYQSLCFLRLLHNLFSIIFISDQDKVTSENYYLFSQTSVLLSLRDHGKRLVSHFDKRICGKVP